MTQEQGALPDAAVWMLRYGKCTIGMRIWLAFKALVYPEMALVVAYTIVHNRHARAIEARGAETPA